MLNPRAAVRRALAKGGYPARNGYTMERANGARVGAKPYVDNDNWTKGICAYSGLADPTSADPIKKVCPNRTGGNNYSRPPTARRPSCFTSLHSCVGTRARV